jgi:hypothetical protein
MEREIAQLQRKAEGVLRDPPIPWECSKVDAARIVNLTGEVLRLRNEDAHARQLNDLENEW